MNWSSQVKKRSKRMMEKKWNVGGGRWDEKEEWMMMRMRMRRMSGRYIAEERRHEEKDGINSKVGGTLVWDVVERQKKRGQISSLPLIFGSAFSKETWKTRNQRKKKNGYIERREGRVSSELKLQGSLSVCAKQCESQAFWNDWVWRVQLSFSIDIPQKTVPTLEKLKRMYKLPHTQR